MNHHYVCRVAREGEVAGFPFWRARVVGEPPETLLNGCGAMSADAAMRTLVSNLLALGGADVVQGRVAPTDAWSFACELVVDGPHPTLGVFCDGTEKPDVAWVLNARPDLVATLLASRAPVEDVFGAGTRVRLEIENYSGSYVTLQATILGGDDSYERLEAFDDAWWIAQSVEGLTFFAGRR